MKKTVFPIGIIVLLLMSIIVSGCTSSSSQQTDPQKDLYVVGGELSVSKNRAGSDEWLITGNIEPKSKTKYSDATIQFIAMDGQNNTIGNKTVTLNFNENTNGAYVQIVMNVPGTVDHVYIKVLNATKL